MQKTAKMLLASMCTLSLCAFALAGCSSSKDVSDSTTMQAPVSAATSASASASTATQKTIGTQVTDGATIALSNGLGKDINGVYVKATADSAYGSNLMGSGNVFKSNETATLYCPAITTAATGSEVALRPTADVRLTCSDGSSYELHQLNLTDIKDAKVALSDGVAYLEYTSATDSQKVSTLETEKGLIAQAQQSAAEAQAATAATADGSTDSSADENASDSSSDSSNASSDEGSSSDGSASSDGSSSSSDDSGSSDDSSSSGDDANSGGEDQCIPGGVQLRG